MSIREQSLKSGLILAVFAGITTALIAIVNTMTIDRIAASQKANLLDSLNQLVPAQRYDNDLLHDTLSIKDNTLLHLDHDETAYRARKNGQNVAVIFPVVAPDGYSGKIKLLVAIEENGQLAGVRVLTHKETAGLGDAIEKQKSNWIDSFNFRSLANTTAQQWHVKKDNGVFDQFTGATVTPRAVVKAVHNSLLYYQQHKSELFAQPNDLIDDESEQLLSQYP